MPTRIEFWRVVNVGGRTRHSVLKTFVVPDGIPDCQALEAAKRELCEAYKVREWHDCAHGYEVEYCSDDRRARPRRDGGCDFWTDRVTGPLAATPGKAH